MERLHIYRWLLTHFGFVRNFLHAECGSRQQPDFLLRAGRSKIVDSEHLRRDGSQLHEHNMNRNSQLWRLCQSIALNVNDAQLCQE